MKKKTHRDEGHPQDGDGRNDGAQPAQIEGPRLEVLCIEEPHCNGDGICSRSTEWTSNFWHYHCKSGEEDNRLWVELFRLLSSSGCLGAIRAWQCSGDLAESCELNRLLGCGGFLISAPQTSWLSLPHRRLNR